MKGKEIKYQIGIDLAIKPSWWKRLLVRLGIKKRDWDYSCVVISHEENDIRIIDDIKEIKEKRIDYFRRAGKV